MLKIMFDKEIRPAQNSRNSCKSNKAIEFHWSAHNFDLEVFFGWVQSPCNKVILRKLDNLLLLLLSLWSRNVRWAPENVERCLTESSVFPSSFLGVLCTLRLYHALGRLTVWLVKQPSAKIQMQLILLCVLAELAVLGCTKTALKFKYEI